MSAAVAAQANDVRAEPGPRPNPREIHFIFTELAPVERTGRTWLFPHMTPTAALDRVLTALGRGPQDVNAVPTQAGDVALVRARRGEKVMPLAFVSGATGAELQQALRSLPQ